MGDIRLKYSTVDHPDNPVSAFTQNECVAAPASENKSPKSSFFFPKGSQPPFVLSCNSVQASRTPVKKDERKFGWLVSANKSK